MREGLILEEHLAKIMFESMHEESWHEVRIFGIEGNMYRTAAANVIKKLQDLNMLKLPREEE